MEYDDIRAEIIARTYDDNDQEVIIRIFRWVKSHTSNLFGEDILKRIPNYGKTLKKLRNKLLIQKTGKRSKLWKVGSEFFHIGRSVLYNRVR